MSIESRLYRLVESFAREHFGCRTVRQQIGTRLGKIDVVGLLDVPGDRETASEIVAIEVKEERAAFLTSAGQALAYSIYAHNCYLAVRKRYKRQFDPEERRVAAHFGIGLIAIDSKGCKVVLTSKRFAPEDRNVLQILSRLGLFRCSLCRGAYAEENITAVNQSPAEFPDFRGNLNRAIARGANAKFWLHTLAEERGDTRGYVWDCRYLCKDCVSIFGSLMPKA